MLSACGTAVVRWSKGQKGRQVSSRDAELFLLSKTAPPRDVTRTAVLLEYITEQKHEDQRVIVALLCSAGPSVIE